MIIEMVERKEAAYHIDFADAELISFTMNENSNLIIYILSWDDRTITLNFNNIIYCAYNGGFQIVEFYEIRNSPFLNKVLSEKCGKISDKSIYKHFQVECLDDADDEPCIEIVAENVTVTKDNVLRERRWTPKSPLEDKQFED